MFGMGGPQELLIILAIVLIVFGGKKIPELMGGLGKGVKSFKKGLNEAEEEIKQISEDKEEKTDKEEKKS